ncbi:MAG: Elastase inhibitor AFLEI Flags: Precursor [Xanthomonadales bacterium]|nr:Elastase inhibitor AFLEI Flags: Precursor [Xanthomonadales bacterium]
MSPSLPLLALLTVAACAPVAPHDAPPPDPSAGAAAEPQIRVGPGLDGAACDASRAQDFVGRKADADTQQAAMAASGAKVVRVLRPGMMVTMEYRGDRLNLRIDGAGKILSVTCG